MFKCGLKTASSSLLLTLLYLQLYETIFYCLLQLFYMIKGDMCLKVVEQGKHKDIPIKEGEVRKVSSKSSPLSAMFVPGFFVVILIFGCLQNLCFCDI